MSINAASQNHTTTIAGRPSLLVWLLRSVLLLAMAALPTAPFSALLLPSTAHADDEGHRPASRQKVLILRADGTGVTEPQRQAISKELQTQALRYRQLDVVLAAGDLTEEMFEFECTEPGVECLSKIGNKYAAQLVVYSELAKNPSGQLQLNMRVIDVAQGRVAQTTVQPLDQIDKPTMAVQRGLVVLLGPVDMPAEAGEATGTLQVVLFGGGVALVYVDDKLVGRTSVGGLKVQVAAGPHMLRVVRAGFKEWTAKITVAAGAVVEQAVQLEQQSVVADPGPGTPGTPKPSDNSVTKQWWFWTAVGVGVVAIGTAAYYLLKPADAPRTGSLAVSLDHVEAYLDPVFAGSAK
ncbi:MAG: PEGA domain-containing protein [Deltaproteobacteria bacterium]|nr:PEGA domain-containing protein [Deltaproteobacteria bacterium]